MSRLQGECGGRVNVGTTGRTPVFASDAPQEIFLSQLPNPLLQELPLWFLLGQRQSFLIRGASLSCPVRACGTYPHNSVNVSLAWEGPRRWPLLRFSYVSRLALKH